MNDRWATLANELGQLGLDVLSGPLTTIDKKGYGEPQPLAIMLMSRTLQNFKGVFTLLEAGLIVEARVLIRCCYENAFWVAGIAADGDKIIRRMLDEDMRGTRTLGEIVLSKNPALDAEAGERLKERLRVIKKENPDAAALNPKGVANDGPLADLYMVYSRLSADAAHPTITSLNRHTVKSNKPDEKVIDVVPAIDEGEFLTTLDWACNAMLLVCVGVNQILGGPVPGERLISYGDRHQALSNESRAARNPGASGR